jgi:hypothetical protein
MRNPYSTLGILKMYACASAGITSWEGLADQAVAPMAHLLAFSLLLCVALIGLVDAVVNDILPDHYEATLTAEYRYFIFVFLATGQLSVLHAAVVGEHSGYDTIRYALDAAAAILVAVLDIGLRRHHAKKRSADSPLPADPA